jgi:hypothetical protein
MQFLVLLSVVAPLPALAQDTTPPVLTGFTFSPAAVNTATSPATVTVTEQITDDRSGVKFGFVDFISPSGGQEVYCYGSLISGTDLNGTWQCQMVLPGYGEAGAWTAAVSVEDNVGNNGSYDASDLQALGFPATLQVTSNQDTTPPVLTGFTFSPAAVNTVTSPATVTVTEQITDDRSGVKFGFVDFTSPSGGQDIYCYGSLISGTGLNGTWQCQMVLPAYGEAGAWTAAVSVQDNVGNNRSYNAGDLQALGFPATLQVTSNQDTTPPVLTGFTFSPAAVNTATSPATVTVTEQITDDLSGVKFGFVDFTSPSGGQDVYCYGSLISGTDLNGAWQCQMVVPAYSEAGAWTAEVSLEDNVGNSRSYNTSDLQAMGFPTTLDVDSAQERQSITFEVFANQTFGTGPFTVIATASSGLPVSFASITPAVCTVSYAIVALGAVGICTIQATQSGNANYTAAPPVNQSFRVTQASQIITFGALSNQALGAPPLTVSATASSGLPVSFASITPAVCTVSGATVTLGAVGACTIQATQSGNANYAAAPPVNESFQVSGYTISGQVTLDGNGLSGVTMTLNGSQRGTATTNESGNYSFTVLAGGSYTVTPSMSGCNFSPPSQSFNNVSGNQVAAFTCAPPVSGSGALQFVPVTPCRIADTRNPYGLFGGPAITGGTARNFVMPSSACAIPSTSAAYSINVTVVPHGPLGYLTVWPTGVPLPLASTLNSLDGRVKANAAIVPAGTGGAIGIYVTDTTDVILDINGYFVATPSSSTLTFFPLTPCRIADTRYSQGPLGGPFISGRQDRTFPLLSSSCNVPATAQSYSLNFTAVPHGSLGYITAWPTGETQPLVSTLNAITGQVTANAAIVPAGAGGQIDVFASNDTDLVIDIDGYFAPSAGGLSLYTLTPCRVLDTRNPPGAPPFSGIEGVNVAGSLCAPPDNAQAYIFNATVVPSGLLGYLTLWPQGEKQPAVSTLNALDGAVTSNMAIVPTTNGSIDSFVDNPTYMVLDIVGYFAP